MSFSGRWTWDGVVRPRQQFFSSLTELEVTRFGRSMSQSSRSPSPHRRSVFKQKPDPHAQANQMRSNQNDIADITTLQYPHGERNDNSPEFWACIFNLHAMRYKYWRENQQTVHLSIALHAKNKQKNSYIHKRRQKKTQFKSVFDCRCWMLHYLEILGYDIISCCPYSMCCFRQTLTIKATFVGNLCPSKIIIQKNTFEWLYG